jgi:hypothetical protein
VCGIRVTLMTGMTKCFTIFERYFPVFAAALRYLLVHLEILPRYPSAAPLAFVVVKQIGKIFYPALVEYLGPNRSYRVRSVH